MYLEPGDVVVPTAIESHIANAHYHCFGSHYARPTYILEVDKCTLIVRILLFYGRKKARLFRVGLSCIWSLAMSYFHIANATLSLAGLAFELFYFSGELAMGLAIY